MHRSISDKAHALIKPHYALAALIFTNIVIALLIGNEFGEGWDETMYYLYGERSLDAYIRGLKGLDLIPSKHIFFSNLRYYGPSYAVLGKLATNLLSFMLKNWSYEDTWHFVNFIFFQVGLISLYIVSKRFVKPWAALGTVFLFATQPLLFGHAFINPKDIPFTTFFTASIASGLILFEAGARKLATEGINKATLPSIENNQKFDLYLSIIFSVYTFSIVGKDVIASLIGKLVSFFYYSDPASIFGKLFSVLADQANRLPVENYIHKAVNTRMDLILIGLLLFAAIVKWVLDENTVKQGFDNILSAVYRFDLVFVLKLLIAGIILGLTTSIRLLGPFAELLVMGYAFMATGKKSIPVIIYYFSIAALTAYLTWPFLWASPTYHFFEAFDVMKEFPFENTVKFFGTNYAPNNLPWTYIPVLMAIQLTEPVIILFIIGFFNSLWSIIKTPREYRKLLILYSWFLIPIILFISLHSSAYDNFRQFFFILPPMFVLSGMALDLIFRLINSRAAKFILLISLAIPGIIGITTLHPYEYIYYNSFVGGERGTAENFETDYWLTSYREAAEYLNANAPIGAKILVLHASFNVQHNARKDLRIFETHSENEKQDSFDYAVITTRYNSNISLFPNAKIVYEVRKNGVLLAVVKQLK